MMALLAWANCRLLGLEPEVRGDVLNVDAMLSIFPSDLSRYKKEAAQTILHKAFFAESGIYGPILMSSCRSDSVSGGKWSFNWKSESGKCARWLKNKGPDHLSPDVRRIWELVVMGKRMYYD